MSCGCNQSGSSHSSSSRKSCCPKKCCKPTTVCTYYPPEGVTAPFPYSPNVQEIIAANDEFAANYPQNVQVECPDFRPENIAPSKNIAILSCMDARVLPNLFSGLCLGTVHNVKNAGGLYSEDVIRSLVISYKLLGTREWFVIQHSDCGMLKFTQEVMDDLLEESLVTATLVKDCNRDWRHPECNCECKWRNDTICGGETNKCIDWKTIECGLTRSVIETVAKIKSHHLVGSYISIYGAVYDVFTGKLTFIPEANRIGAAKPMVCSCEKVYH